MLQESLENSPIRTKRSTEMEDHHQQNGSKDGSLDDQQIFAADKMFFKLSECAPKMDDEGLSDLRSRNLMNTYDQRNQLQLNDPHDKSLDDDHEEELTNQLEEKNNNFHRINISD